MTNTMKKLTLRFLAAAVGCLCLQGLWTGCSNEQDPVYEEKAINDASRNTITAEEAVSLACKAIGQGEETRSSLSASIGYVLNNSQRTRSVSLPDTLAYIINFEANGGFALVSTMPIPEPVMAYSPDGQFELGNELVNLYVLPNIAPYMEREMQASQANGEATIIPTYSITNPPKPLNLDQESPWNKYVALHDPGCPVGCLAVATATLLLHTQVSFEYEGETYNCFDIKAPIFKHTTPPTPPIIQPIDPILKVPQPDEDYYNSVDKVAYMLDWIGKEVKTKYDPEGSGGTPGLAVRLLRRLTSQEAIKFEEFSSDGAATYLQHDHLLYIEGALLSTGQYHAWVSDGCRIKYNGSSDLSNASIYLHFDWGWGGNCNGYYQGNLINMSNGYVRITTMMPLKYAYTPSSTL